MGTTTNNGWTYPESTDLVKDGATAIQTLADDIDTTLGVYAPSTPGLTLINTTSFSAVASQSVNDVFSATYDNYRIVCEFSSSTDQEVFFRLRASGADLTGNVYRIGNISIPTGIAGTFGSLTNTLTTQLTVSNNGSSFSSGFVADIISPNKAQAKFFNSQGTGRIAYFLVSQIQQATAYTGYTIYCTAATTLTGTISTYGYSK
jgi:hypothetical protein